MKRRVVVAMSGGVDSSVAAALLQEQGCEVVGFFMRTGAAEQDPGGPSDRHRGCCSARDAGDARFVAGKLGIHFYALNFERDFDRIIDYFAEEYRRGRTPNPCVVCNDRLKFGKLLDYARSIGADAIATGHYARVGRRGDHPILRRAVDRSKDQSYVLFGLQREIMERVRFPLGGLTKEQVREEARRRDLPVFDKPDSVDICFVPDRDYAGVVAQRQPGAFESGSVVDQQGQVRGTHRGIGHFTIGQRRGLGIALGMPIYVTSIDPTTHTVRVGARGDLLRAGLLADRFNWFIDPPTKPLAVQAKIRYQHQPARATATCLGGGVVRVDFAEQQSAVTPGQAVVLYQGDDCLGGGWIQESMAQAQAPEDER